MRPRHPRLPVMMFSTLTERGASVTLDALAAGASDYVAKPANVGSVQAAIASVRTELGPKHPRPGPAPRTPPHGHPGCPARRPDPRGPAPPAPVTRPATGAVPELLAIGASTGGPNALSTVLAGLPADLPVPVVVVQHMPPLFTRQLAERLDRMCAVHVAEGEHGAQLRPGHVWSRPADGT